MEVHVGCGGPILVADGDPACRALVVAVLERAGHATCVATTGYEALALAESTGPSLVLLEVELPGITGYEVCSELRDSFGDDLPLVLLSATRVEPLDRLAGLLIGADDYIVKPFEPGELLARVRSLLRRRRNRDGGEQRDGNPGIESLTPREREVLDLLSRGRNQAEIARELFITPKTVATHIQHVLAKLEVHSRAQAVALALRHSHAAALDHRTHAAAGRREPASGTLAAVSVAAAAKGATAPSSEPEPEIVAARSRGREDD